MVAERGCFFSRHSQKFSFTKRFGGPISSCSVAWPALLQEVYRLSAEKLRQVCSEEGLDAGGPVQYLRQRIVRHLKVKNMAANETTTQYRQVPRLTCRQM